LLPFIFFVASLLLLAWLAGEPLFVEWRRKRLRARPFPVAWRRILARRVPYLRTLPADLRIQIGKHIQVFVAEKAFIGCRGLAVTEEMRVTIAAQACLLILNRRTDYFAKLRQILVYPGAFAVERVQADGTGVIHERRQALSGESWSLGQVVLSWEDALEGAAVIDDGRNVVIHEFAHQLDQEAGRANGAPWLGRRERYARWSAVLGAEYQALVQRVREEQPSLISDYGATDPAEFFAVVSEVFFEQARQLAEEHPALYRELAGFYRVDPAGW
jgi:Mlc titration factor MtfA (ptsG expression regulator)